MGKELPESEDDFLRRISKLEEENSRLRRSIRELSILNEIAIAISSALSLDKIIDFIINKCIKHFKVEQGAIMLLEESEDKYSLHTMARRIDKSDVNIPYRLNTQLTGWMIKNLRALLVNDLKSDERFKFDASPDLSINSLLAAPLVFKNKIIGIISLFNKKEGEFTEEDKRFISIVAIEAAQLIENARLHQKELEYQKIEEELRLAAQIQRGLLPGEIPGVKNYDIAAINLPARSVSGDYYDIARLSDSKLFFCVGDVSGKGIPAALLASSLQATLHGQVLMDISPSECMKNTNFVLYNNTTPEKFATLFYGLLDVQSHELFYVNAGHNPPFFFSVKERQFSRLEEGGIILGFMEDTGYDTGSKYFDRGDVLVVYSDGVSEAMNERDEEFSEERLKRIIEGIIYEEAGKILNRIIDEVRTFSQNVSQNDDITLMVIKRVA